MKVKSESEVAQLCPTLVTPWTADYQAPPSMGFSRQEYWSGVTVPIHEPSKHCHFHQSQDEMINLPQIWIILKEIIGSIITNDAKVWLMGTFFHCGEWEFFWVIVFSP